MKTVEDISQPRFIEDPQSPTSEASVSEDIDAEASDAARTEWKRRAQRRYAHARAWVRDHPVPAIGIAIATGFVAGRIFRR